MKGRLLPESTIIVSSRPSVMLWWQCQHNIDRCLEVLGDKIHWYAESIFSGDILQGFLSYIKSNPSIYGMMYIPLNAVIVALTYKYSYDVETPFPKTMTQLYEALTHTLIRRHLTSTGQAPPHFCMPQYLQCMEDISFLPMYLRSSMS